MPASKTIYLIRHCKATGQAPDAELTADGLAQAQTLAETLAHAGIQRIVTSPFLRARQSIQPLADRLNLTPETDPRLVERTLSSSNLPNWFEQLRATFHDFDLCLPGGESNRVAQARGVDALRELLADEAAVTAVVTHGNLMTLLLHHFDPRFGFDDWHALTNPDIYQITIPAAGAAIINHIPPP